MYEELSVTFEELFKTEKYQKLLRTAIERRDKEFFINFNDLHEQGQNVLTTNYFKQTQVSLVTKNDMNSSMTYTFNKYARIFGFPGDFKNITMFITNVGTPRSLRTLATQDINKLLTVNGVVTSVSKPQSIIRLAAYRCTSCGELNAREQNSSVLIPVTQCGACNSRRGLVLDEFESTWCDYQEIKIQENPEDINEGIVPRTMTVKLMGRGLIDSCKPGDISNIVSALNINPSGSRKTKVYSWCLEANSVDILNKDSFSVKLTEEDELELINWSKHPQIREIIINSIFPNIYEYTGEKYGLTLAMFGGRDHIKRDLTRRGTIHVLLLGDPSTAKSRMILAAKKASPKGVYASAGGASGVGLTAALTKVGDEWVVSAGSLVLADLGICCVDELEKMDDKERTKIHDAMAIQMVRIDKGDVHMTLNARTSMLAAANPSRGRYDEYKTMADNISLPSTIIARFDLIFIIKDTPDEEWDRALMNMILRNTEVGAPDLPQMEPETLKKYILYAKQIQPIINEEAISLIVNFYVEMRKMGGSQIENPIAITARQGEAIRRLTEASARMSLKSVADKEDAELAIELMMKCLEKAGYDPTTQQFDISIIETKKPASKALKANVIEKLLIEWNEPLSVDEIAEHLDNTIDKRQIYQILRNELGDRVYNPIEGKWQIL